MNRRNNILLHVDWLTILIFFVIVFFGWINIYSAVFDETHQSMFDVTQRYGKQLIWIGASVLIIFIIMLIDANIYETFAVVFYLSVMTLLVLVLFVGKEIAGSKSWFQIGGIAIQPSEFAKFATVLFLAKYLTQFKVSLKKIPDLIKSLVIIFTPSALILLQNDTGSALVFGSLIFVLFREGMNGVFLALIFYFVALFVLTLLLGKWIVLYILLAIISLLVFKFKKHKKLIYTILFFGFISISLSFGVRYIFDNVLEVHQRNRIDVLLGKKTDLYGIGYNVHQSKIAIGSGGFSGKGFLQGTQTKYNFVPEQSTDFIFCTVGEEWGFLGTTFVILLYLGLLFRIIFLAERQRSRFSRIYGYGVASIIFFHFLVNIGMVIGLMPVIGIPLPMFSYGGSSLWSFTILIFIFLKLDANRINVL